jgi:hypothetical protein
MRRFLLVVLAAAVAITVPALAATTKLHSTLNGKSETPKSNSKATGKATFTIASNGKSIKYTLSAKGLTGPVIAAHVHFGKKGKAGPVILPICPKACKLPKSGTLTAKNFTKAAGVKNFAAAVKAMKAGNTYANIHTKKHPAGEIRGQITK